MTLADVDQVLAQLGTIGLEVLNPVTHAPITTYTNAPFSIPFADEPALVWLPSTMTDAWEQGGAGEEESMITAYEDREYVGMMLVKSKGQGQSGEVFGLVTPYFALLRNVFESHQSLKGLAGVMKVMYIGDDGVRANLNYAGVEYYGTRIRLRITTAVNVTFAQGE